MTLTEEKKSTMKEGKRKTGDQLTPQGSNGGKEKLQRGGHYWKKSRGRKTSMKITAVKGKKGENHEDTIAIWVHQLRGRSPQNKREVKGGR